MISRFKNEEYGYSLIEVVVAILLLSLAIIPMVSMFDAGLRAAVLGSNYDTARTTASEELEEIKALPYEDAVAQYPPGGGAQSCSPPTPSVVSSCEVETTYVKLDEGDPDRIAPDPDVRSMMQVKVTTEWDGGSNRYITTGLVSQGSV